MKSSLGKHILDESHKLPHQQREAWERYRMAIFTNEQIEKMDRQSQIVIKSEINKLLGNK